jgi:hypothetical protein
VNSAGGAPCAKQNGDIQIKIASHPAVVRRRRE